MPPKEISNRELFIGFMLTLLATIAAELNSDNPDKRFIQTCLDAFVTGLDRL